MFDLFESLYVVFTSIALPLVLYMFAIPKEHLVYIYWTLIGCFGITSCWVFIESISSLFNTTSVKKNVNISGKSILILIPAYMDNEQFVLKETLEAFCKLKYDGKINVIVVYNVNNKNKTTEFENYLNTNWNNKKYENINFQIFECTKSKSKAENVNYALKCTLTEELDYICVFDADHQPKMDNLEQALYTAIEKDCDVVQGQCAIRNINDTFVSRIITMEFTEMYNIGHQGRVNIFNMGIFGGSNGIWKASLLRKVGMDHTMLTEDIDSSFKSLAAGQKITYSRSMVSFELAPINWGVLVKQRKRWAQGWLEVSIKYCWKCLRSEHLSMRQKVACFLILFWRELFVYLTFHPLCVFAGDYFQRHQVQSMTTPQITLIVTIIGMGFIKSSLVYLVANDTMKNTLKLRWFVLYILFYPFYAIFLNMVHISTHYRHHTNKTEWIATTRETSPTVSSVGSFSSTENHQHIEIVCV